VTAGRATLKLLGQLPLTVCAVPSEGELGLLSVQTPTHGSFGLPPHQRTLKKNAFLDFAASSCRIN
jgi:hypothetical protein